MTELQSSKCCEINNKKLNTAYQDNIHDRLILYINNIRIYMKVKNLN